MLLVGLLAGLILFHEFEATLQVTTDSYWFFFPPPPHTRLGFFYNIKFGGKKKNFY